MNLSDNLEENFNRFNTDFVDCSDFLIRKAKVGDKELFFAACDGLIDSLQLSQMVVSPILKSEKVDIDSIKKSITNSVELNEAKTFADCYYYIMSGFAVAVVDGENKALAFGIQNLPSRSVDEPSNEQSTKAPKEAFVEVLNTNKALLRKRLKTPHLKLKQIKLASCAPAPCVIAYMDDRADNELVSQITDSIQGSNLNVLTDFGTLIPFIDTSVNSMFSAVSSTERPDIIISKLLEGRVAILVEGSSIALYTPSLFSDNFQTPDDYDTPPFYSGFIRILRYFSFVLSVFLPGGYVAIGTFHQELIPTSMLFTVVREEITTPYSLMTEALMLLVLYEIMREAGLRLPKAVGHAVSIIGGIVIGETTVSAGLIGAPMLVVIALTAISSYVVSSLYESVSVLRFFFILIGGFTGMYGIILAASVLCMNICAINPYGVPYSSPISPLDKKSLADLFYRQSWLKLSKRKVRINNLRGANIDVRVGNEK